MGFFDRGKGPATSARGGTNSVSREREPWMDDPDAIRDRRERKPPPGPPGGGKVWDWSNQEWADMPNLNPRRPWSRTNLDGTRTGDPNERIEHFPGSASGEWSPDRYRMDENGNWVPRPTGYGGIPLNDDGKPIYTPDPVRFPEYFKGSNVQHSQAQQDLWARREAERAAILAADPEYQQAKAAGDRKGMTRAELRLKDQNAQRASGMTPEAWRNRFNTAWPVPRSRNGQYWYRPPGANGPNDPGRPGPTPPGVQQGGGDRALPPAANPMMEGYQPSGNDVIAALSRIQSMPIGAPTAATGSPGGFARAASGIAPAMSAAVKKPTIVRRGGGVVTRA